MAVLSLTDWNINWCMERKHDTQMGLQVMIQSVYQRDSKQNPDSCLFSVSQLVFNAGQSQPFSSRFSVVTEVLSTMSGHFVKVGMIPCFLPDEWFRIALIKWDFVLYLFPDSIFLPFNGPKIRYSIFILLVVSFEISLWVLNIKKNLKLISTSTFLPPNARSNTLIVSPLSVYAIFVYCHYM